MIPWHNVVGRSGHHWSILSKMIACLNTYKIAKLGFHLFFTKSPNLHYKRIAKNNLFKLQKIFSLVLKRPKSDCNYFTFGLFVKFNLSFCAIIYISTWKSRPSRGGLLSLDHLNLSSLKSYRAKWGQSTIRNQNIEIF